MLNKLGRKRIKIVVGPRKHPRGEKMESEFGITPTDTQGPTYTEAQISKTRMLNASRLYLSYPDTRNLQVILKSKATQECDQPADELEPSE